MPIQPNGTAPYAPPATILGVIDRARERGLPAQVTKDVLVRTGVVTESLAPRVLQSLQLLELVNEEGNWTQNLETLRRAPEAEVPARLAEILRSVYADVFQYVDPAQDSPTQVRDAFRAYTPHGQQDRMVTLFINLCQRAGIAPQDTPRATVRELRPAVRKPAPAKLQSSVKGKGVAVPQSALPLPLAGLLQTLPQEWTKNDRDRFVSAFTAMLDYCIPVRTEQEMQRQRQEEGTP